MREGGTFDERMVEAIRRIRGTHYRREDLYPLRFVLTRRSSNFEAAGKWRVIALTNNFSKTNESIADDMPLDSQMSVESELAFLGWEQGPAPPKLRILFDDFCDSSTLGMRCVYSYCFSRGITDASTPGIASLNLNFTYLLAEGMESNLPKPCFSMTSECE